MSLRTQEWLKTLANENRLFEALINEEYLVEKTKTLRLKKNVALILRRELLEGTYRPLGGNEVDRLLESIILDILSASIREDSGPYIHRTLNSIDWNYTYLVVQDPDLEALKKQLFRSLKAVFKEDKVTDLVWKAAKLSKNGVLVKIAPLLKREQSGIFIRDGQILSVLKSESIVKCADIEFGGFLIKTYPFYKILPAKNTIESYKRSIKSLTNRSKTGYSVRHIANLIKEEAMLYRNEYGFCTDSRLARYLDSYTRERVYLFLLKKYQKSGKKEVYRRFMLRYPTLEGIEIPSVRPVREPCAVKAARTVRGAGD